MPTAPGVPIHDDRAHLDVGTGIDPRVGSLSTDLITKSPTSDGVQTKLQQLARRRRMRTAERGISERLGSGESTSGRQDAANDRPQTGSRTGHTETVAESKLQRIARLRCEGYRARGSSVRVTAEENAVGRFVPAPEFQIGTANPLRCAGKTTPSVLDEAYPSSRNGWGIKVRPKLTGISRAHTTTALDHRPATAPSPSGGGVSSSNGVGYTVNDLLDVPVDKSLAQEQDIITSAKVQDCDVARDVPAFPTTRVSDMAAPEPARGRDIETQTLQHAAQSEASGVEVDRNVCAPPAGWGCSRPAPDAVAASTAIESASQFLRKDQGTGTQALPITTSRGAHPGASEAEPDILISPLDPVNYHSRLAISSTWKVLDGEDGDPGFAASQPAFEGAREAQHHVAAALSALFTAPVDRDRQPDFFDGVLAHSVLLAAQHGSRHRDHRGQRWGSIHGGIASDRLSTAFKTGMQAPDQTAFLTDTLTELEAALRTRLHHYELERILLRSRNILEAYESKSPQCGGRRSLQSDEGQSCFDALWWILEHASSQVSASTRARHDAWSSAQARRRRDTTSAGGASESISGPANVLWPSNALIPVDMQDSRLLEAAERLAGALTSAYGPIPSRNPMFGIARRDPAADMTESRMSAALHSLDRASGRYRDSRLHSDLAGSWPLREPSEIEVKPAQVRIAMYSVRDLHESLVARRESEKERARDSKWARVDDGTYRGG